MVYAYHRAFNYRHFKSDKEGRPLSKTFVIDLTQGERVFVLEPDLIVRDAFIYDDKFCLLGKSKSGVISLFQYDIVNKTAIDMLEEYNNSGLGIMRGLSYGLHEWVDEYSENFIIESVFQIEGHWYFQCRVEKQSQHQTYCKLCTPKKYEHGYFLNGIISEPIIFPSEKFAIEIGSYTNKPGYHLSKYDLLTEKRTWPDEGADAYILLGDYLYKRCGKEWYRTNTSQGWDNLQWEYLVS